MSEQTSIFSTVANASLALSYGAIALLAVVAMLAARDARQTLQGRVLILLALSVAALEAASGPGSTLFAPPMRVALGMLGSLNVALLWIFCLSILRDDFRLRPVEWGAVAVLVLGTTSVLLWPQGAERNSVVAWFSAAAPFVAIAHIGWVAISERSGDLVEPRRRVRLWIPAALATAAAVSVLSEEIRDPTIASILRNGLATLPMTFALLWWLTALDPTRLRFESADAGLGTGPRIDPRDRALHAALRDLMEASRFYREPELTIDALAARLSTPTHRLRALINSGLGFRNFAAFINRYRLAHAKAALADPERARETILSIAYDAGFASLQTFNRVFRDGEGVTPTGYRATALAQAAQDQKMPPIS